MNEGEKILWSAINRIAWGSDDEEPPFRAAPREVLIELARKAVSEYRNLTSRSNRVADVCASCGNTIETGVCPQCDLNMDDPPPA